MVTNFQRVAALAATLLFLSAGFNYAHAEPLTSALRKIAMSYVPGASLSSVQALGSEGYYNCGIYLATLTAIDPVDGQTSTITVHLYEPARKAPGAPAIITLPPTGGITLLDRTFAGAECDRGFEVALIYDWTGDDDPGIDFSLHERETLRSLAATRHVLDYLDRGERFRPIGLLGTSVGAIESATIAGYEPRIRSVVFIAGGGPLAGVLTSSDLPSVRSLKTRRFQKYEIRSDAQYEAEIQSHFDLDPVDFANYSGPKPSMFFIGTKDTTVPTDYQMELWRAWGEPEHYELGFDHLNTIIATTLIYRFKIFDFFSKTLIP